MAEYTYKKHDNGLTYRYRNGVIQDDVYNFELHLLQRIDQLEQERDSLKAHCEDLRCDLRDAMEWNWLDDDAPERMRLDKTPAQSLSEIQAQAIEPVLLDKYEYFDEHGKYTVVDVEDIKYRIQQLREDT